MTTLRLSAISYLNAKPLLAGLQSVFQSEPIEIVLRNPTESASAFLANEADVALVPSAALLGHETVDVLDEYCVGAMGAVESVLLVAKDPVEELEKVYLDPESRTSNGLARLLFKSHWRQAVEFAVVPNRLPTLLPNEGAIIIGDAAMHARGKYPHIYDLSEAWHSHMGLPFVFAVWALQPGRVSKQTRDRLRIGMRTGLRNLPDVAEEFGPQFGLKPVQALRYFSQSIQYQLDTSTKYGLAQFLAKLGKLDDLQVPKISYM